MDLNNRLAWYCHRHAILYCSGLVFIFAMHIVTRLVSRPFQPPTSLHLHKLIMESGV